MWRQEHPRRAAVYHRAVRTLASAVIALGFLAAPAIARAQVDPDPLVAPVVFHWQQWQTPWPTLEGGSIADGSVAFWRRQITLLESSGFTGQLFQVSAGDEQSQRNHLAALRERRLARPDGPLPPRVVPFFAAETFPDYLVPKDVLSRDGFERFYQAIRSFFLMYAEVFPAKSGQKGPCDTELFATVDGRVFIALWWVPLQSYELPSDFFASLSDRLARDFGFKAYWSVHEWLARGGPDDVHFLFNGPRRVEWGRNPAHPAADLIVAFWPPNLDGYTRELFAARDGGAPYGAAWDAVIAARPRPSIVLVESYNEITEGSHLMPSWPAAHAPGDGHWSGPPDRAHCAAQACHPVEFTDAWGPENPWHYLDISLRKIREWLNGPLPAGTDEIAPHALILAPRTDEVVSGATPVKVVAADDRALREVRLYIDGWLALTSAGSIDRRLKSSGLGDGRHVLRAEAVDRAGNVDVDVTEFIVRNAIPAEAREPGAAPGTGPRR
jgi:hypothetical protein